MVIEILNIFSTSQTNLRLYLTDPSRSAYSSSPSTYFSFNGNGKTVNDANSVGRDATEITDSPPETRKIGPSARRGKNQREKRQLRQKRRSTGVVNKKDVEESENTGAVRKRAKLLYSFLFLAVGCGVWGISLF